MNPPHPDRVYRGVEPKTSPRAVVVPDSELIGNIVNGDQDAVAPLIARYEEALMRFLLRATRDSSEAEDLFQETWMRVVRSAHRFDPSFRFSTWLFRISLNLVRKTWRRRDRRTLPLTQALEEPSSNEPRAEEVLADFQRHRLLLESIRKLPPRLAEAVLLRYFEELTEREMSQRLSIPPGTVKSRLHHGLRRLAGILEGSVR